MKVANAIWEEYLNRFQFQPRLTKKLDNEYTGVSFTQGIINEIVLWKVNRYAELNPETLNKINKIDANSDTLDETFTIELINDLLEEKGIQIAMASTILRFKNPAIYQIMDQRVHRYLFLHCNASKTILEKMPQTAESYILYLRILRVFCDENGIEFKDADRILYQKDKEENKNKIKY